MVGKQKEEETRNLTWGIRNKKYRNIVNGNEWFSSHKMVLDCRVKKGWEIKEEF